MLKYRIVPRFKKYTMLLPNIVKGTIEAMSTFKNFYITKLP